MKIKPLHWAQEDENKITTRTFGGTMCLRRFENRDFEAVFNSAIRLGYDRWLGKSASAVVASSYCDKEHERRIGRLLEEYTIDGRVKPLIWGDPCNIQTGVEADTFGGRFFIRELECGEFSTTFFSLYNVKYDRIIYQGEDKVRAYAEAVRVHRERVKKFLEPYVEGL